jgi:transglutaminase-like putative cysteine protease
LQEWLFSNLHDKALKFLLGILLYQYVIWFDFYWLAQTRLLVEAALLITLICAIFIPSFWLRGIISTTAIIWVTHRLIQPEIAWDWQNETLREWTAAFFQGIVDYGLSLSPFVWFALAAWVLYAFLHWYLQTQWRMVFFLIASVVVHSAVDSFSQFVLWEQVAIIIGCGLLMLVIQHVKHLKLKDPDGYVHLMSYPLPMLVMIVTIVSGSILLGIVAPSVRPLVMDPYTAWITYQGKVVPLLSSSPGFVRSTVSVSPSSSGYSRNDLNLGNTFNFDYSPVFTVDTTRRSYWRGETKLFYNGQGWENGTTRLGLEEQLTRVDRTPIIPKPLEPSGLETIEVTQTVRMISKTSFPVLFAAPYAFEVKSLTGDSESVSLAGAYWDRTQQAVIWSENSEKAYPSSYTIVSRMPVIDEAKLRTAKPLADATAFRDHLQLPTELPGRVVYLAEGIVANANNPYDQAKALSTWLSRTFTYTNKPDLSKRQSSDFVDSFLFEMKAGYCDYYSTAMVVMARSIGLPARWVKGYVSGQSATQAVMEQFVPDEAIVTDGPDLYTVRNSDAHSWVEIYFQGFGWVPFEPTPGFTLPLEQVSDGENVPLPRDEVDVSSQLRDATEEGGNLNQIVMTVAALAFIGLVLALIAIKKQWFKTVRFRTFGRFPNYNLTFQAEMERMLLRLRRRGFGWSDHQTLREMIQSWSKTHAWMIEDMEILLQTFEKAKYSKDGITEVEFLQAIQRIRKLRESL